MKKKIISAMLAVIAMLTLSFSYNVFASDASKDTKESSDAPTFDVRVPVTNDLKVTVHNKGGYIAEVEISWVDANGRYHVSKNGNLLLLQSHVASIPAGSSYVHVAARVVTIKGEKIFDQFLTDEVLSLISHSKGTKAVTIYTWGTYYAPQWKFM